MDFEAFPNLVKLVREASLSRLRIHSRRQDIVLIDKTDDPLVCGHWMAIILVSGKDLRVTFKVHFMTDAARSMATHAYGKSDSEITRDQSVDFLKEFCNLSAGHIKRVLEENGLSAGISLPVLTRGYDEVFFARTSPYPMVRSHWQLISGDQWIDCSTHIEVFNKFEFSEFESKDEKIDDLGDVEFF